MKSYIFVCYPATTSGIYIINYVFTLFAVRSRREFIVGMYRSTLIAKRTRQTPGRHVPIEAFMPSWSEVTTVISEEHSVAIFTVEVSLQNSMHHVPPKRRKSPSRVHGAETQKTCLQK